MDISVRRENTYGISEAKSVEFLRQEIVLLLDDDRRFVRRFLVVTGAEGQCWTHFESGKV